MKKTFTRNFRFFISTTALLILFLICTATTAQEYNTYLSTLSPSDAGHLQELAEGSTAGILITQNAIQNFGTGAPSVAICEINAIHRLYESNSLYSQIKFIRIDIRSSSDLNNSINLALLQSFTQLQYVYFFFQFDACGNQSASCLGSLTSTFTGNSQLPNTVTLYRWALIE